MKNNSCARVGVFGIAGLSVITALSFTLPLNADAQRRESWRNQFASTTEGSGVETETHESQISTWRQNSSAAQSAIDALGSTRVESIAIPVLFGIKRSNIVSDFGDPRGDGTRSHEGQDLISKTGVPIVSPTDAVVTNVGYGASSGNFVYTANPGGETFVYMHLDQPSALVRGAKVSRGDLVGYVGTTGNAAGGVAHLHFEIRKGGETDPYPRLTAEFSTQEKSNFLGKILTSNSNPTALASLLVSYHASEFNDIKSQGVSLPSAIETALANAPVSSLGYIMLGSSGSEVITLQTYLINADKGSSARALAGAGATGYFGNITRNALIEFQTSVGISADGVYGPVTKAYVANNPMGGSSSGSSGSTGSGSTGSCIGYGCPVIVTPPASGSASIPTADLGSGSKGSAVIWLQTFLINQNKGSAARTLAGAGATGNFGPITVSALSEYQSAVGISPASGYFGPITRAYLKTIGAL